MKQCEPEDDGGPRGGIAKVYKDWGGYGGWSVSLSNYENHEQNHNTI